jgi:hypothetical protein
MTKI